MRLAIAGAGMIVKEVLPILKGLGIELEAICATERSSDKLKSLSEEYGIKRYFTDYDKMLTDENVDTVYIALPNILHYDYTKRALNAGKNVICEKPFTVRFRELKELRDLAKKKNLILIEAITTLYLENYIDIKNRVEAGMLGDIKLVSANYSQYSSRYGNFRKGIISPSFDPKYAGGALMDLNIYNIHFVCGIFGRPKEVYYYPAMEKGIDTSGNLVLIYDDFLANCISSKASNCDCHMQIQGSEAAIVMDRPANECSSFDIFVKGQDKVRYDQNKYNHRMTSEFVEFLRIIDSKDYEKAEEMMKKSLIVMEVIDKARKFL